MSAPTETLELGQAAPEGGAPDNSGTEGSAGVTDASGEPSQDGELANTGTPDPVTQKLDEMSKQMQELASANKGLADTVRNLQVANGKLGNLVGVLREQSTATALPPRPDNDAILADPKQGIEATVRAIQAEDDRRAALVNSKQRESMDDTMLIVRGIIPDFDELVPDMVEHLRSRKVPAEGLQAFQTNPAAFLNNAGHLAELADLAKERRGHKETKKLLDEARKQIEELKKGPERMAKQLSDASKAVPTIAARDVKPRGDGKSNSIPDFRGMSDAEFAAYKQKYLKR